MESGNISVGLSDVGTSINYNDDRARNLLDFLFIDLPRTSPEFATRSFDVIFSGQQPSISLWRNNHKYYSGQEPRQLAFTLTNEVIHDCIQNRDSQYAIHAAAFALGDHGILLPGQSGSGKSSLAAWLTTMGWTYLTDELVLLSDDGLIRPFTRPISLRPEAFRELTCRVSLPDTSTLSSSSGNMVAHRALHPQWKPTTPKLKTMIFPSFKLGQPTVLTKVSSGIGCLKLIGSHVDAHDKADHGFSELANLARTTNCYELHFGGFDDLADALSPITQLA